MRAANLHLGVEETTLCKIWRMSKKKASTCFHVSRLVVEYAKVGSERRPDHALVHASNAEHEPPEPPCINNSCLTTGANATEKRFLTLLDAVSNGNVKKTPLSPDWERTCLPWPDWCHCLLEPRITLQILWTELPIRSNDISCAANWTIEVCQRSLTISDPKTLTVLLNYSDFDTRRSMSSNLDQLRSLYRGNMEQPATLPESLFYILVTFTVVGFLTISARLIQFVRLILSLFVLPGRPVYLPAPYYISIRLR